MGMLIAVVVADIVIITLWSLKSLDAPASFSLAIKAGLLLMVVGQGLGGVLIREGMRQEEVGPVTSPLVFGQDGILNLSHAAALHALQLLPVLAWLLSFSGRSESGRRSLESRLAVMQAWSCSPGCKLSGAALRSISREWARSSLS